MSIPACRPSADRLAGYQFVQRASLPDPARDDALVGAVVNDFPAFGIVVLETMDLPSWVPSRRPPHRIRLSNGMNS